MYQTNPFAKPQFPNAGGNIPAGSPNILNPLASPPPPTRPGPPPTTQYYDATRTAHPAPPPIYNNAPGSGATTPYPPPSSPGQAPPTFSTNQPNSSMGPPPMGSGHINSPPPQGFTYSTSAPPPAHSTPSAYPLPASGQPPSAYPQPPPTQQYPPPQPYAPPQQYPQPQQYAPSQQYPPTQQYSSTQQYPPPGQPPYPPAHYGAPPQLPNTASKGPGFAPATPYAATQQQGQTPPQVQPPKEQVPAGPRIDPSQIPSPTALADGRPVKFRSLVGQAPGPAAGQYVAIDEANATPRFVRLSMYTFPCTEEVHQTSHIPFAMIVQPLAEVGAGEDPVPLVDFSSVGGPIRCRRCRAYINPFNVFVDGGRKFVCKFCDCENEVPDGYFSPLEGTGKRHDISTRPELIRGSVDFVASSEYIQKPLGPLRYVFVLDVSEYSVTSGMLHTLLDTLRSFFDGLGESASKVAIITFDSTVHFWNLRGTLQQPQMMVVPDVANIFVPMGDGVFFSYKESKTVVDSMLEKLSSMFTSGARSTPDVFAAAVHAASLALESTGGRVIVFTTGVPDTEIKRREDMKLMGTEKERTLYAPRSATLKTLATECAVRSTAIDLFVCPPPGTSDLVSLACLPNATGGNLYYYPGFAAERDGTRLHADTVRTLIRPFGYDAIAKVRCSKGIAVSDHLGSVRISAANDMEIAGVDSDKSIVIALKHDDKLEEKSEPVLQFAMLYTTPKGERRIRVHNICVNCSMTLPNLFRGADLDAILNIYAKVAVRAVPNNTLSEVRNVIAEKCVDVLASYRKYCASSTSPGQLILPESLKLLPIFILALSKSVMLRPGNDVTPDDRAYYMSLLNCAAPAITTPLIYPRLYAFHKLGPDFGVPDEEGRVVLPTPMRLSTDCLDADGIFLLENGVDIYLWIGRNAPPLLVSELQGAVQHNQPVGELGTRVFAIVDAIRNQRCKGALMRVVRSRDPQEAKLFTMLYEDRTSGSETNSYVDFLCTVHKHIQNKLA